MLCLLFIQYIKCMYVKMVFIPNHFNTHENAKQSWQYKDTKIYNWFYMYNYSINESA